MSKPTNQPNSSEYSQVIPTNITLSPPPLFSRPNKAQDQSRHGYGFMPQPWPAPSSHFHSIPFFSNLAKITPKYTYLQNNIFLYSSLFACSRQ
jgi:hypothetical protein